MILRIFKYIFFISGVLSYLTTYSISEIYSEKWNTRCSEDKKTCIAVIKSEIKNQDKLQTIATAYIQIGSTKQKKMDLINEDDQTYKLSEKNTDVPVLFVKLPLNVDLRKKPAIVVDTRKLGDLNFSHCNQKDGCVTNVAITNDVINFFKKGKTMFIIAGIYRGTKKLKIEFPLTNFSKSYAKLIKE